MGVIGVFVILWILTLIIELIGRILPKDDNESTVVNPFFADLPYFKQRDQADLVIITTLMKKLGHQGKLSIKRIN